MTSLTKRYASQEMKELFSSSYKYQTRRKLWIALAQGRQKLGLPVTASQIDELKSKIESIDFDRAYEIKKKCRHEVMAYREDCPNAGGILHLGATSSYVMDNGDLIVLKSALHLLQQKLVLLIEKLNHVALKEASTPCLAYTHFQPAQGTTFGKRCALWLQDFVTDFKDLLVVLEDFPFLGCKGAIGMSGSFLTLFKGDH